MRPWSPLPNDLRLESGQIHLIRFRLDLPAPAVASLARLLSDDEQKRADRLLVPEKRRNFMVGRGRLRQILGHFADQKPASLKFRYGPFGKPELQGLNPALFFNLSHAGTLGLMAVTADGAVGVDIEQLDATIDYLAIARRFFPSSDVALITQTGASRRVRTFYRHWTCREALLKAEGCGLANGSFTDDASLTPRCFFLARNYVAALATENTHRELLRWQLGAENKTLTHRE